MQFQGKGLPFFSFFFSIFPFKRPLLQNCEMHSSICTNGYFFLVLHWHPCLERSWRDLFRLKTIRLTGAGLVYSLSAVTNVLFFVWFVFPHVRPKMLQLLLDGQDDEQNFIIFFIIYKLPTKERKKKNAQQGLSCGLFTKWFEGRGEGLTRNKVEQ